MDEVGEAMIELLYLNKYVKIEYIYNIHYTIYKHSLQGEVEIGMGIVGTLVTVIFQGYICCIKRAGSTLHWVA